MATQDKRNHITIAKAIGIILMVIGHAGLPSNVINDFIYIFHMPLFFSCSGYFFKEIYEWGNVQQFCKKRISGLYIPYLKWSLLFLLLHNVFFQVHINNSEYQLTDFYHQAIKIIVMSDYEAMLRPFWFLKTLLLASISTATLAFLCYRFRKYLCTEFQLLFILLLTLLIKYINTHIPVIGDLSIVSFGIAYILSGFIYRKHEHLFPTNYLFLIIVFSIVVIGSVCFVGTIDMRYTTLQNIIPYYSLSILGIILTIKFSVKLNDNLPNNIKNALYYIGNHTMVIFALHLLAFKLGNLAKIWIYDMPIERLSDHTIIADFNDIFWIIYVLLGIAIPLLLNYLYNICVKKLR